MEAPNASAEVSGLVPAIVVGFAIVFPLFWCGVIGLISAIGGWGKLARSYAADPERMREGVSPGDKGIHHLVSGMIGIARYKSVLTVRPLPAGFYLSVMPLFRFGHPPLFLPWGAVLEREAVRTFGGGRAERLVIGHEGQRLTTILLPASVLEMGR